MTRMLRMVAVTAVVGMPAVGCMHSSPFPHQGPVEAHYDNLVDRCWPNRYAHHARENVIAPFATQVTNGAILDQTIWNYMFDGETDKLNPAGLEKLDYLARRRPAPDSRIFLQSAQNVAYDPAHPEKFADGRQTLDEKRGQSVLKYMAARTAGRPLTFEVQVIDPADPSLNSNLASSATRGLPQQYRSGVTGGAGGTVTGAGGGAFATPTGAIGAGGVGVGAGGPVQ